MKNDSQTYLRCEDCGEYVNSSEEAAHDCGPVSEPHTCPDCHVPLFLRERVYLDREFMGLEDGDPSAPQTHGDVITETGDHTYHPHYRCPECSANFAFIDLRPIPKGMEGKHDG